MSFYEDDVTDILTDFAIPVTLVGYPSSSGSSGATANKTINAIFDEAQEIIDVETGQVISAKPQLTCKTSDVSAILRHSACVINGVSYYVIDIMDDGTGVTMLKVSTTL